MGIYDKDDEWLNQRCRCGHIRYFHTPGREQGSLDCQGAGCSCQRFEEEPDAD